MRIGRRDERVSFFVVFLIGFALLDHHHHCLRIHINIAHSVSAYATKWEGQSIRERESVWLPLYYSKPNQAISWWGGRSVGNVCNENMMRVALNSSWRFGYYHQLTATWIGCGMGCDMVRVVGHTWNEATYSPMSFGCTLFAWCVCVLMRDRVRDPCSSSNEWRRKGCSI